MICSRLKQDEDITSISQKYNVQYITHSRISDTFATDQTKQIIIQSKINYSRFIIYVVSKHHYAPAQYATGTVDTAINHAPIIFENNTGSSYAIWGANNSTSISPSLAIYIGNNSLDVSAPYDGTWLRGQYIYVFGVLK